MSWLSKTLGTSRPGAPTLPPAPTLQTPQLPQYPGLSPEQQALLQQQQGYLGQAGNVVGGYGQNPYFAQNEAANMQALTNYQNALMGKIDPNQMLAQQKQRDWEQTVEAAGQQGIRLAGKDPGSAVSQSTAGNQIIQDFNKRYGALEQQYNLGQQQFGMNAANQGFGQLGQMYQNQLSGYGQLANQANQLYQPYLQQQLGPYEQATNQAMSNTDIYNQNAMNAYNQQMQQIGLNYNNALAGYQNRMGLVGGALGLGGMALGGMMGGPMGAMIGGQAGNMVGNMAGGGGQQGGNMYSMLPYIQAYQNQNKLGLQRPQYAVAGAGA